MIKWIKDKLTTTEYVDVVIFNYAHYEWVYGGRMLAHKCADVDDTKPIYEYGKAPCGASLVCNARHVDKFFSDVWRPFSVQSLDPDAPLTSELNL